MNITPTTPGALVALTMTSREIAELTGKDHKNVARDILSMLADLQEDALSFERIYFDSMNRAQKEYVLDRELTDTLLTGYSAVARRAVIARWHKLETEKAAPAMDTDEGKLLMIQELATKQLALIHENKLISIERDHAIATKAQIGSKREATAMATASAATRKAEKLMDQLGFNTRHATVIAVEGALGKRFGKQDWRPLKAWCKDNGASSVTVPCARYGKAQAWPAGAWGAVYGVDLVELFGAEVQQ